MTQEDPAPRVTVLVVDDEAPLARALARMLTVRGFAAQACFTGGEALSALAKEPDVVLLDLVLPDIGGMQILHQVKKDHPDTEVVMMTAHADINAAVEAVKGGAYHFLTKPFTSEEAVAIVVEKAAERRKLISKARALEEALNVDGSYDLIGSSPSMQRVFAVIRRVAGSSSTVHIEGESGTGKELVARAIHRLSPRRHGTFVPLNCSAIPENLIESELFGHIRGAFTGAAAMRRGLFEAAHGGTLFLDEVADLPALAQVKLLRALQEGEVRRVGSDDTHHVDVRVISASNTPLAQARQEGKFREDLFYRLNVITVDVPPLRDRLGDIEVLAQHFLRRYATRVKRDLSGFAPDTVQLLVQYPWPGNVRELENAIERAVVMAQGDQIKPNDFPPGIADRVGPVVAPQTTEEVAHRPFREAKDHAIRAFESRYVEALLHKTDGNVSEAARLAGLDRSNFRRIMKRCYSDGA